MTDEQINEVVSALLRERFKDAHFTGATVRPEEDFDGTSILRVIAQFRDGEVPSSRLIEAMHDIRTELLRRGESRFVFLDAAYPQQELEEEETE